MKKLEFGNYTLKFGEEKVLLDLYEEIVLPTFLEMKYIRKIKNGADYFFIDTEVIKVVDDQNNPVVGICGRIVKNTKLKREQIFRRDGGVIEDKSELETAPSSTFLLILNNHRLIFSKEVAGAPTIDNFKNTSLHFLKKRHLEFLAEESQKHQAQCKLDPTLKARTKKSLYEEFPTPSLRITPLPDKQDLRAFVSRFKHIEHVSIKLLPTNREEIDNDDFWCELARRRQTMNSNSAKVDFYNKQDGLDPLESYNQTNSASNLGNSEISFKGHDKEGDSISGDNNDFSLSVDLDELSRIPKQAAETKYQQFMNLAHTGAIALPQLAQDVLDKIKVIFDRL